MLSIVKRILNKCNALNVPAKASLWFVICNCLQKATQIITTPIYTRILSTNQYGEYTVFLSWVEIVAIVATLDIFYGGFNVGMERFKKDRKNYASAMHGLCIALTTIWVIIGIVFATPLSVLMGISPLHIKLLLGYMYVYPIYLFWSAQKKYDYNYKCLLIVTLLTSAFTIGIGSFLGIYTSDKSTAVILAKIFVESIVAIPLLVLSVNGIKSLFNKHYWIYALKFNLPLTPHYFSTMILNHSDRIMILNMCGAADAAIYSVAYSIAVLMTIVQNGINGAITPWLYGKLSSGNLQGIRKTISEIIGVVALLNLGLIFFAPEAVRILSTSLYYDAIWVIPPVSFGVFFTYIYGFFVNIELYYGNNKWTTIASSAAATSNLILNYFFIRIFGYYAAGYTTLASYGILTIVHYLGAKKVCAIKKIDFHMIFDSKLVILIMLLFGGFTGIAMVCYKLALIRYLFIVILFVAFLMFRKKIHRVIMMLI